LQAVGCALGSRKKGKDEVVYVSSGEGTTAQGDFHEALNWATRDKLPVIFLIQNNKYAISVPVENQLAGSSIYKIGSGYEGLNCFKVDGTDFFRSYDIAHKAVDLARTGGGPSLIEAETIRLLPHSSSDSQTKYRNKDELERDKTRDPLPGFESFLINNKYKSRDELDVIQRKIKEEIDQAAEDADKVAHPSPDSVSNYVFAPTEEVKDSIPHTANQEGEREDKEGQGKQHQSENPSRRHIAEPTVNNCHPWNPVQHSAQINP